MVRLRNSGTGAVVSVPEEKAERLGSEWVPVVVPVEPVKRAPGRPKKSE